MRILLTGATGFVGRNLLQELLKYYKVRCLVRKDFGIKDKNLEIVIGDIRNNNDVKRSVNGVDYVVHAAAVIYNTDKETFDINVNGTKNLVESSKKFKVKKFIFISTENVIYSYCDDAYTNSKREAEEFVKTLPNYLILRPSVIYGKGDDRYISYLIKFIKKYPIIPVLGSGKNLIQPIYIEDLIRCILNCIKYNIKGNHLVYGADAISYNSIIRKIQNILGVKRLVVHIPLILLKPIVFVYNKLVKNAKIKYKSLSYLKYDRKYDPAYIHKNFKYKPTSLEDGIGKLVG